MSGTIKDADILFGKPTGDEISFFKFSRPPRVEGKFRKPRRQMMRRVPVVGSFTVYHLKGTPPTPSMYLTPRHGC